MEILPTLCLWLLMPLDCTPPPIHAEQLALFPGYEYAAKQRRFAAARYEYAKARYSHAFWYAPDEAEHWCAVMQRCHDAAHAWSCLCECYRTDAAPAGLTQAFPAGREQVEACLASLYNAIGPAAYWSGQLPGPVDVSGAPESVPLPK